MILHRIVGQESRCNTVLYKRYDYERNAWPQARIWGEVGDVMPYLMGEGVGLLASIG